MSKACNQRDVIASFLYLESLRKRGVLDNASPELLEAMSEKSLEKLMELAKERERMMNKREEIGEYPVVNLISKDYAFFLDYEEQYSKPIKLGDGRVSSRYALQYHKDEATSAKFEGMSIHNLPQVVSNLQRLDYPNREGVIVTMLKPEAVFDRLHKAVRNRLDLFVDGIELGTLGEEAWEMGVAPAELREKIREEMEFVFVKTDEEVKASYQHQEAVMPIRYDEKALKAIEIDKEMLREHYVKILSEGLGEMLSDMGIQNGADKILAVLNDENNDGILDAPIEAVQNSCDSEAMKFIYQVILHGLRDAKKFALGSYTYLGEVVDTLTEIERSTPVEVDIEVDPTVERVTLLPTSKKEEFTATHIDTYVLAPSNNDPADFREHLVKPEKITLQHKLGTETSNMLIRSIYPAEVDVTLNSAFNTTKTKSYRISKSYAQDFDKATLGEKYAKRMRRTAIVDEADQEAGGGKGAILTFVFRENASKIVVATGTPINGMPESTVNILQFGGIMRGEDVDKSKAEFETLYGVYSINSPFLALIIQGMNNKKILEEVKSTYANIIGAERSKSKTVNLNGLYESAVKNLLNLLVENNMIDKEAAMNTDIRKEAAQLAILFNSAVKIEAKNKSIDFATLLGMALTTNHTLVTKEPKISSLAGYARTVVSTIGSQAISSTDAGAKKEIIFEDYLDYKQNFHPEEPAMHNELFKERNRVGIRLAQALVGAYKNEMFIEDVFLQLAKTYEGFYRMFTAKSKRGKELREGLLETIKASNPELSDITESEFFTMAEKSTTQGSDSFVNLYRQYLNYNGDITKLYKDNNEHLNKRVDLFREVLVIFNEVMRSVPAHQEAVKRIKDESRKADGRQAKMKEPPFIITDQRGKQHDLTGMSYKYSDTILRGERAFDMEAVVNALDGYGYPSNVVFSFVADLCPQDFNDIVSPDENGMRMPYRLEIKNRADNEVLDAISSIGAKEKMKEQLKRGANIVNLSQRVITNVANVLNIIAAYKELLEEYKRGEMDETSKKNFEKYVKDNIHIVVNVGSSSDEHKMNTKDIFARIKPVEGMKLTLTKREAMEAILKKSVLYNEELTCLCSNYRSVSRGFALHYFHRQDTDDNGNKRIVSSTLNFIDPRGGGDGIQVLSRLESPMTTENIISLYNGGADAKQLVYGENVHALLENMFPTASRLDTSVDVSDKEKELSAVFSGMMSLSQDEAAQTHNRIASILDLPRDLSRTQISVNAERAQAGYATYEMVMRGEHKELTQKQAEKLYGAEVMRLSDIPDEDMYESNEMSADNTAGINKEELREIVEGIENDLDVTADEILNTHQDTAFEQILAP